VNGFRIAEFEQKEQRYGNGYMDESEGQAAAEFHASKGTPNFRDWTRKKGAG
jgi:hypothetical protein